MHKILVAALLLLFSFGAYAQSPNKVSKKVRKLAYIYHATLVPFNSNGTWGWADTLGNVVIKPTYNRTWFFTYDQVKEESVYYAPVKTDAGQNFLLADIGLACPPKYTILNGDLHFTLDSKDDIACYNIIQNDKQKISIYDAIKQRMVVKPTYDSLSRYALQENVILLKRHNETTFRYYSTFKKELLKSDIVAINQYKVINKAKASYSCCPTVVSFADGTFAEIYRGEFTPFVFEDSLKYEKENSSYSLDDSYEPPAPSQLKKVEDQPDGVLRTYNYPDWAANYGFTSLNLVRKNNKLRVVNEFDSIILPFEYDHIVFVDGNSQAQLYKDGKLGRKLFFTHYPTIEAKYDVLKPYKSLQVSPHWSFGIFYVEVGKNVGYVGENGIEYFIFD